MNKKIPCHIVTGMLGSGKTTAILDFLHRRRNREFTAVLVNDFGPNGIDSCVLAEVESPLEVVNVSGGCLCCSSVARFKESFGKLVALPNVDRIIIEPSGVVLLDELLKTMTALAKEFPVELYPVILIVEPSSFNRQRKRGIQYGERLAELADVIAANFSDMAAPCELTEFMDWARSINPPKQQVLSTSFGKLPDHVFNLDSNIQPLRTIHDRSFVADHSQHSGGLRLNPNLVFEPDALASVIQLLAQSGIDGTAFSRLKGIFQTLDKPVLFEIAHGRVFRRSLECAAGNKLDWIAGKNIDPELMHKEIQQECAISQPVRSILG